MLLKIILGIVVLLWLFGYLQIPLFNITLFSLFGHPITLRTILLIGFISYLINFLPGMLQKIAIILFVFWILSQFLPAFGLLGQILFLFLLLAIIFSFF